MRTVLKKLDVRELNTNIFKALWSITRVDNFRRRYKQWYVRHWRSYKRSAITWCVFDQLSLLNPVYEKVYDISYDKIVRVIATLERRHNFALKFSGICHSFHSFRQNCFHHFLCMCVCVVLIAKIFIIQDMYKLYGQISSY